MPGHTVLYNMGGGLAEPFEIVTFGDKLPLVEVIIALKSLPVTPTIPIVLLCVGLPSSRRR
ncbi:hypothetical protein [Rhodopila sp.]|uniref:hypothetical protein n=1 Tax=Rhodopila sp. TaxID=2480087 RepID=UPI003D10248C